MGSYNKDLLIQGLVGSGFKPLPTSSFEYINYDYTKDLKRLGSSEVLPICVVVYETDVRVYIYDRDSCSWPKRPDGGLIRLVYNDHEKCLNYINSLLEAAIEDYEICL